jgi:hypothetical protein
MNYIETTRMAEELVRTAEHHELLTLALQQQPSRRHVRNLRDFYRKRAERWQTCQECKHEQLVIEPVCRHCGGSRFRKAHSLKTDPRMELAQRMQMLMDRLKAEVPENVSDTAA